MKDIMTTSVPPVFRKIFFSSPVVVQPVVSPSAVAKDDTVWGKEVRIGKEEEDKEVQLVIIITQHSLIRVPVA